MRRRRGPEPYHMYVSIPQDSYITNLKLMQWIDENRKSIRYLGDVIEIKDEETYLIYKLKFGV